MFGTADDRIHQVQLVADYNGGATVHLQADGTLGTGYYRFTANSTLKDLSGNRLDGNANGTEGEPYDQTFSIRQPDGYLFEDGDNDTLYTATTIPLTEDPAGSGLWLARGLGRQEPATSYTNWSDPDYWRVELQAGDWLTVSVDTPNSNLDLYVQLLNASGENLAADDNDGPDRDAMLSRYQVTSDGAYYVKVGKYYYNTTPGSYELRLEVARGIQQESDANYANDAVVVSNALMMTTTDDHRTATVQGTLMASDDEDFFSLGTVDAGESIFLSMRTPEGSALEPVLEVWDSANAISLLVTNPSTSVARYDVTTSRVFFARVHASDGQGTHGQYLLDAAVWPTGAIEFADLAVSDVSAPEAGASGETVHVEWTVGNYGTGATDQDVWTDRVILSTNAQYGDSDDIELTSVPHTGTLGVDETYTTGVDVQLPLGISGTFNVFVATDHSRQVYEYLFEDNNLGQNASPLIISLTPSADLEVSGVTAPIVGVAGQSATIEWTVTNQGAGTTGDGSPGNERSDWIDRIVLSTNTVYGDADDRFVADVSHSGAPAPDDAYWGSFTGNLPSGLSGHY